MSNITYESNELKNNIEKLKIDAEKMRQLFENIRKDVNSLPEYWESNTSSATISEFESLYQQFDTINESNKKYIDFLENIVSIDYENKDKTLNNEIDGNI